MRLTSLSARSSLDPPPAHSADPATRLPLPWVPPNPPEPSRPATDLDWFAASAHLPRPRRAPWLVAACVLHASVVAALVLLPLWEPDSPLGTAFDPIRVLIYDPPPPPPPPLPKGSPTGGRARPTAPPSRVAPIPIATPGVVPESALRSPTRTPAVDDGVGLTVEAPGSPNGSESGVPEGMEEGVEGGVVGGVPGGVVGGVIGGTGTGPVPVPLREVDLAPRLLRQVRPIYPHDAFVKKVEGTVVIEIVIDEHGRVARTRIVRSVPALDAAAVDAVLQWTFVPAQKRGRPVATIAVAPVSFRIF